MAPMPKGTLVCTIEYSVKACFLHAGRTGCEITIQGLPVVSTDSAVAAGARSKDLARIEGDSDDDEADAEHQGILRGGSRGDAMEINSDNESEGQQPRAALRTHNALHNRLSPSGPSDPHAKLSVHDFVLSDLLEYYRELFLLAGLEQPEGWDQVSEQHLECMEEHNNTLIKSMKIVKEERLPVSKKSMERISDETEMLDDDCVYFFLQSLVSGVGAEFASKNDYAEKVSSPYLRTNPDKATRTKVLDVQQAQKLRDWICELEQLKKGKQSEEEKIQGEEAILKRMVTMFVGRAHAHAVLTGEKHLTDQKSLSIIGTSSYHTTLTHVEFCDNCQVESTLYDSLGGMRMDSKLRRALDYLLTKLGLKKGDFKHKHPQPKVPRQKDGKVCALMALTCLTQILTGEKLDEKYWDLYVDLLRRWTFLKLHAVAVSSGAIQEAADETASERAGAA